MTKTSRSNDNNIYSVLAIAVAIMAGVLVLSIQSYYKTKESAAQEIGGSQQPLAQEVTVLELKEMIDQNENFFLVDTRPKSEFADGHIEKSISIPPNEIEFNYNQLLPPDQLIVLTCQEDICQSLDEAVEKLTGLGFTNLGFLSGGIESWESYGYPLTSTSGRDQSDLYSISASELNSLLQNGEEVEIIDVRPREEYLPGHIPSARSIPLTEIASQSSSLQSGREIVIYSNQAHLSSLAFQQLTELGLTQLYILEGGFNSWTQAGFDTERR